MPLLSELELRDFLIGHPLWTVVHGELTRQFLFADFPAAILFVDQLAPLAEQAGHHPDIDIRYNRVKLCLVTHDAGGLTKKDIGLASAIEARYAENSTKP